MIQHNNQTLFLEWFNDFLTFNELARYHRLTPREAATKVRKGRVIHESQFSSIVFDVCNDY